MVLLCLLLQLCGDVGQRPSCLVEKQLEGVLKHITRRFPNIDTKVRV